MSENPVLIIVDQLHADALRCCGNGLFETPHQMLKNHFPYESLRKAPWIPTRPKGLNRPRGEVDGRLVSLLDLRGRTRSCLAVEPPEPAEGLDLRDPSVTRPLVFSTDGRRIAARPTHHKPVAVGNDRDNDRFFDLRTDPRETQNPVGLEDPEIARRVDRHRGAVWEWRRSTLLCSKPDDPTPVEVRHERGAEAAERKAHARRRSGLSEQHA